MSGELKKGPEVPTSTTSVPPPAEDLQRAGARHTVRLTDTGGRCRIWIE